MNDGKPDAPPKAEHGARSEVSRDDGQGRQPYANQEAVEGVEPGGSHEFSEGDRGAMSGRNLEQFEQVKKLP